LSPIKALFVTFETFVFFVVVLGFGMWDVGFTRKANGPLAASTGNIDLL
jgi:hypothetical protein